MSAERAIRRKAQQPTKRLALVGEQSLIIEAIRIGVMDHADFSLARFGDDPAAAGDILASRPSVVLVEDMPHSSGLLSLVAAIRASDAAVPIVMLTDREDVDWLDASARAGVDVALAKTISPSSIFLVLREIADGKLLHLAARSRRSIASLLPPGEAKDCPLTERELEILQLLASGATNSQIATRSLVTEQTVKFHVANILRKLGVANRTEASRYAHLHGLVDPGVTARPVQALRTG